MILDNYYPRMFKVKLGIYQMAYKTNQYLN